MPNETEETIQARLLDEFLDRMVPDLQFEVKGARPNSFTNAFELAQHYELLLESRRKNQSISVADFSNNMEIMALQRQPDNATRRVCYYCHRPGHMIRDCEKRKRNEGRRNFGQRHSEMIITVEIIVVKEIMETMNKIETNPPIGKGVEILIIDDMKIIMGVMKTILIGILIVEAQAKIEIIAVKNIRGMGNAPTPKVSFSEGRSAHVRVASPYLILLVALISLFAPTQGLWAEINPMICLPDSPASLWHLPDQPICPSWKPLESPIQMELTIFRPNTLQYKTPATVCKCIKSIIHRRIGFFGKTYEQIEAENIEIPTSTCWRMHKMNHSPAGELIQNGSLKFTNNSLEVGWTPWPIGLVWSTSEVLNCYAYESVVFTRHGQEGVNTPVDSCPNCQYKSGSCRCNQAALSGNQIKHINAHTFMWQNG